MSESSSASLKLHLAADVTLPTDFQISDFSIPGEADTTGLGEYEGGGMVGE